jgi:hypothetical protein
MANLTVAEKTHWKERIEARINRRIEAILAAEPGLMDRVKREAKARALASLGLAELQAEIEQIAAQKAALDWRDRRARRAMLAWVRGVDTDEVEERYYGSLDPEVNTAITRRQAVHEDEILAGHELGRQVVRIRAEKDRLLDVIWLATSPVQVRQLSTKVGELIGDEPTQLEREALAIPPAGEEAG